MRGRGRNNLMQPRRVEIVHEDRANGIKHKIPPLVKRQMQRHT